MAIKRTGKGWRGVVVVATAPGHVSSQAVIVLCHVTSLTVGGSDQGPEMTVTLPVLDY